MRMILVHGINQQGKSAQKIHDDWLTVLRNAYAAYGSDPLSRLSRIDAAFYGDTLEELSSINTRGRTIALGAEEATDDFDDFAIEALKEMAMRIGVTEAQIQDEIAMTTVAQGAFVGLWPCAHSVKRTLTSAINMFTTK
jgi:hypothetical protein